MSQLSLFEDEPKTRKWTPKQIARSSDPETSKQAAEAVAPKITPRQRVFVQWLIARGAPSTASEVGSAAENHSMRESIRKRAAECVANGWVEKCARKVCSVSGSEAAVYRVTELGRKAVAS